MNAAALPASCEPAGSMDQTTFGKAGKMPLRILHCPPEGPELLVQLLFVTARILRAIGAARGWRGAFWVQGLARGCQLGFGVPPKEYNPQYTAILCAFLWFRDQSLGEM